MAEARSTSRLLTALGAATAGVLAFRAARAAAFWTYVRFGPSVADQFKGEYALVTGASEGIGLGIATALAARGMKVALVSRSEQKLAAASAHIKAQVPGAEVLTIAADLTKDGAAAKVLKAMQKANGADAKLAVLVCNAGGGLTRAVPYAEYTDAELELTRKLNGDAAYTVVRAFLPGMQARGRGGHVALVSSLATKMPAARLSTYGAEKAKLNALAESLQAEQDADDSGIGVEAITLGAVVTPALASFFAPEAAAKAAKAVPKGGAPPLGWEREAVAPSFAAPSAADAGEWIVRAMGKGAGAVVTPYPGHALMELVLDARRALFAWPPALRRAAARAAASKSLGLPRAAAGGGGSGGAVTNGVAAAPSK